MNVLRMLKITVRNFRNNLTSVLIKILGLAVSIAAVLVIWSYVIHENKYDSGIKNSNRIYRLDAHWASLPAFIGHILNQNLGDMVVATRINFQTDIGIQVNNVPFNLPDLAFADSTFFRVLPLELISGNPDEALSLPFTMVISESVAKKLFGTTDVIGKMIRFQDEIDFTITGVMKDYPFLHLKIEVIASMISREKIAGQGTLTAYDGWSYPTYLMLPDGANVTKAESSIIDLLKKFRYDQSFHLKPFNKIYYSAEYENESNTKHGNLLYNRILIAVSIFILLLASINFINLTIANALSRSKEVSLKKLQGASRSNLIFQFLFETVIFILISVVLAFIILWFMSPVLSSLTGFTPDFSELWSKNNFLILSGGLVSFIIISGIYPSFYISSYTINSLKYRELHSSGHLGIRNSLIIFQNLVSITLICCTLIADSQFRYMNRTDLGFNKENVLILKLNSQLRQHVDLFRERLLTQPFISGVSYSSRIPGTYWGSWCCVNIEGQENKYFNNYVDPWYLETMGIRIKEGRNFSAESTADIKTTYLINETAIEMYGLKNPVGQVITPGNGVTGQIIGVFRDFHYRGLNYELTPVLLFNTREYKNYVNIKLTEGNTKGAIEFIKSVWEEVCPAFSFEYKFLDVTYDLQYQSERRFENLIFSFAMLALFIACIGLFGLSVFSIERRTKEIGIRKVNGANTNRIVLMLNRDIIIWVFISFIAACPIAWYYMHKWLQNFAFRTEIRWWMFILAGLIALLIALVSVSLLSWRVATRNPVEALRYE